MSRRKVNEKYPDGSSYQGEVSGGKRDGYGIYRYRDGSKYTGNWKNHRRHGEGEHKFPCGDIYSGQFKDGEYHGKGRYLEYQKEVYEGSFVKDYKHGSGKVTYPDKSSIEGFWNRDKMHGSCVYRKPDGYMSERIYENGNLIYEEELMRSQSAPSSPKRPERPPPRIGRYAFLVGQNLRGLVCCHNDAMKMGEKLVEFGYDCTTIKDAKHSDFKDKFCTFLGKIKRCKSKTKRLFVYFSGHGNEHEHGKLLLECKGGRDVRLNTILKSLNLMDEKDIHVTVVIDACRSDDDDTWMIKGSGRNDRNELIEPPTVHSLSKSFILGFACAPGRTSLASGKSSGLSLFTGELLKVMNKDSSILWILSKAGGKVNAVKKKSVQQAWVNFTAHEKTVDIKL